LTKPRIISARLQVSAIYRSLILPLPFLPLSSDPRKPA